MKARLYDKYVNEVVPALKEKHKYAQCPPDSADGEDRREHGRERVAWKRARWRTPPRISTMITGRKPAISKSRHSIANFKLREGQPIGCRVTLRRDAMYEFFDRLVAAALPRIRDFRGLSPRKFDGRGNYTFGVADQTIFPEIELDKIKRQQGMDVTIVTSAPTDARGAGIVETDGLSVRGEMIDSRNRTKRPNNLWPRKHGWSATSARRRR